MKILKRIYDDFFRPCTIGDYEKILKSAVENGYEFHSVLSFENVIGKIDSDKKYLILRRDVDTADYKILKLFAQLENKYKARYSYYFRLNTVDYCKINKLQWAGEVELSYHYEELSDYIYHHRIKNLRGLDNYIDGVRDHFIANLRDFRKKSGQPCLTVASHGDFINTKLHKQNTIIVNDRVRKECNIIREAYDLPHINAITCRIADQSSKDFTKESVDAIERGEHVIELLTHPRQWNSSIWVNLKEEIIRALKGLIYIYLPTKHGC